MKKSTVVSLTIETDEMSPTLEPDDVVLIDYYRRDPQDGDVIVGFCKGKPFCRRWSTEGLKADNPAHNLIADLSGLRIVGTVQRLIGRHL